MSTHDVSPQGGEGAQEAQRIETDGDSGKRSAAQAYLDEMVRSRGYVLDYHKYMASADHEVLQAANDLVHAAYLKPRSLDRRTKELLFVASLTVMRAEKAHIISHIKVALDLGVSPKELLEAIEIALPEAGVVAFQGGFAAWCEAVKASPLEPSSTALRGDNAAP
jgi:4-carboxymuconolactone decarboxylase